MPGKRGSSEVTVYTRGDEKGISRERDGDEKHLILRLVVMVIFRLFVSSARWGQNILRQKQAQPAVSDCSCRSILMIGVLGVSVVTIDQ